MKKKIVLTMCLWAICMMAGVLVHAGVLYAAPAPAFNATTDDEVLAIATQSDQKILIGGYFTQVINGTSTSNAQPYLARLNSDGSFDSTFAPTVPGPVYSIALQADGKIVVGGYTVDSGNAPTGGYVARFNSNGSIDFSYSAPAQVNVVVIEPSGDIVVGGSILDPDGNTVAPIYRLAGSNGHIDGSFTPSGLETVWSLAIQIINGNTYILAGQDMAISRLTDTGSADSTFATTVDDTVFSIALQGDGKIVIGGLFATVDTEYRSGVARLNVDGTVDSTFIDPNNNVPGTDFPVYALDIQANGNIILGGDFTQVGGNTRTRIARLNSDGSFDSSFRDTATDSPVEVVKLQTDGKILVGGLFTNIDAHPIDYLARLNANGTLDGTVVAPVKNDFNGDGQVDILWRNSNTGDNVVWFMNGTTMTGYAYLTKVADPNWQVVGTGDFNGDGQTDILWRHSVTGDNVVWFMNGTTMTGSAYLTKVADPNWQVVGTGDFNGDGQTDILWRHSVTGDNVVWFMNGTTMTGSAYLTKVADPNWKIAGTGDFNGDGQTDILWRHSVTGDNVVWFMNGTTMTGSAYLTNVADPNWKIAGTGDFNGDGLPDILWRHSVTGDNVVWFMNGTTMTGYAYLTNVAVATNWQMCRQ